VADHTRAALLGAQDRQRPQQTAGKSAAEGQAVIAENRDAETSRDAEAAFDAFSAACQPKYDKAAACLAKDRRALPAFYDFPAEHWKHLRTSNPIESTFATVPHRTIRSRGCLSHRTALAMVFKLVDAAQKSRRRLDGHNPLPKLIHGVGFTDGIKGATNPASSITQTAAA
jgi:putative transposase